MAGKYVEVDVTELKEFCDKLRKAGQGELKKKLAMFLDAAGFELLRFIQDEIIRLEVVDTRKLLTSFKKGKDGNVYVLDDVGLTLEIGTNVKYASYVNDGHWTIDPSKNKTFYLPNGEMARFVPGYWEGDSFKYDKTAKTGMVLKQQYIEGRHFVEKAVDDMETMFPGFIERKLEEWINSYF